MPNRFFFVLEECCRFSLFAECTYGPVFNLNGIIYHNSDINVSHAFVHRGRNANSFNSKHSIFFILQPRQNPLNAVDSPYSPSNNIPSCCFLDQRKYWNWHALHFPTTLRLKIKPCIVSSRAPLLTLRHAAFKINSEYFLAISELWNTLTK